ncbi:MAG TPA: APC family permease [Longimicrobium sp.]|nr:APC family permease [Longimicrobium sp.]
MPSTAPPADPSVHRADGGRPSLVRGLTLLGTVALVVGNMVGTSVYTLPASLAQAVGPLGIVAWGVTAAGYLFVALVYASLGTRYPLTGGPYVYAREAFGDFAGFQAVWSYWISTVVGNAAIVTAVVGYAVGFSRPLAESTPLQFALAQALLWALCLLNVLGIRQSARLQVAVMCACTLPMLFVSLAMLPHARAAHFTPFAPHGWGALAVGAALVVWAYSGVESATVPAEEVQQPGRTIRRGTLAGYALATVIFLVAAVAVTGALPAAEIASSARPIALAATRTLGPAAGAFIGAAAIAAGIGTLNGWILMAGRIPLTAARDGIFFRALGRVHPRFGTPHVALVAGTAVASAMLLMYFAKTLLGVFNFIVLLSVLLTLVPHLYAAAAELMLARRDPARYTPAERRRAHWVAPIAFAFLLYTVYGVGAGVVLWGFLALLAGMPLYIWFATRPAEESATGE